LASCRPDARPEPARASPGGPRRRGRPGLPRGAHAMTPAPRKCLSESWRFRSALAIVLLAAGGLSGQEPRRPELVKTFTVEPEASIATWASARVAGGEGSALVLVGRDGLVATWT